MTNKIDEGCIMVYKANKLIEARYSLSLNEQKLILYASSKVNNFVGDNFTILKMSVSDFFSYSNVDASSKNHNYIRQLAKGLMGKQLEIEYPNGGWELIQWVSRCKYEPNTGVIEFEFSPEMKPYLLKLEEHYRGYPLTQVMQLDSKYSIRLYELLIQWEYTNHKSLTIKVDELRKKMGLLDNEYERFDNFENRVIKTAVTELNNVSNIYVTYDKIKKGRKIDKIKFKFEIKTNKNNDQIRNLEDLKNAGLANYIDEIKEVFNDKKLIFTDLQIDRAYMIVFNKLNGIDFIQDQLNESIYRYMLYYYEFLLEKAGRHAYNYYIDLLTEDYAGIQQLYKFGRGPDSIVYGQLL